VVDIEGSTFDIEVDPPLVVSLEICYKLEPSSLAEQLDKCLVEQLSRLVFVGFIELE
jgi:hypothetical protein|tara:strand:- start:491 stop:661 length:171 start_codon:yes stop_codon:yes gene_type:complete